MTACTKRNGEHGAVKNGKYCWWCVMGAPAQETYPAQDMDDYLDQVDEQLDSLRSDK